MEDFKMVVLIDNPDRYQDTNIVLGYNLRSEEANEMADKYNERHGEGSPWFAVVKSQKTYTYKVPKEVL